VVKYRREFLERYPEIEEGMNSINLLDHTRNEHSQFGEDGIIETLFALIGVDRGYFVEFGAWDGIHFSNTRALYLKGWSGSYIEGDPIRFRALQRAVTDDRVSNVNAFVTIGGENSFDNIMTRLDAPRDIDLLSIDIDSDDLAIWRSVSAYVAKVVIIEYNPTIPFDTEFENVRGKNWGNSALSLVRLANEKGYDLVGATNANLIFLRSDVNQAVGLPSFDLNSMAHKTRFFWGYDGALLCSDGSSTRCDEIFFLPWGKSVGFQPVPAFLRRYADRCSATSVARILFTGLLCVLMRPLSMLKFLRKTLARRPRS
jgi:hypothetical protein